MIDSDDDFGSNTLLKTSPSAAIWYELVDPII